MSVYLVDRQRLYVGLAADTKPTHGAMSTGEMIPAGSRFVELDTGKEYWWSGAAWYIQINVTTTSTV